MDEKERISLLEREIELLKQVIELKKQAARYIPPDIPPPYYPPYYPPPWIYPWQSPTITWVNDHTTAWAGSAYNNGGTAQ
jgi:hypothetical protein